MSSLDPKLPPHAVASIDQFLRAHVVQSGSSGVVVGVSGGIDSALTLRLACDALGPSKALGVLLPDEAFSPALAQETVQYAGHLGCRTRTIAVSPIEHAYHDALPAVTDRTTLGNIRARVRMTALYAIAREEQRLVLGTGNKSELLLGYFTKYGDGGVDLLPLGDLYKTDVRALAAELDLPEAIRRRPPTAGFWEGQTDEGELGLPYESIDRVLFGLEQLLTEAEIAERTGLSATQVSAVVERVRTNRHKRRPPPVPKLRLRTIGLDWKD